MKNNMMQYWKVQNVQYKNVHGRTMQYTSVQSLLNSTLLQSTTEQYITHCEYSTVLTNPSSQSKGLYNTVQ